MDTKEETKFAVAEAGKMMDVKMEELPPLAIDFLQFLSGIYGFCGGTAFTAYAVYNQMVLGMECEDELYIMTDPNQIKWWADRGYPKSDTKKTIPKFSAVEVGDIALIQQTETGRILQIGLTPEQSKLLQVFLAGLSAESKLIQMPEEYDLILKSSQ